MSWARWKPCNDKNNFIKDAKAHIKKYEAQQSKVRNNREYDSLSKEIEFQNLEIQLAEKRIKETKAQIETKKQRWWTRARPLRRAQEGPGTEEEGIGRHHRRDREGGEGPWPRRAPRPPRTSRSAC
jgi:predicted  nucleic acid-binding Zn-ribbon protein